MFANTIVAAVFALPFIASSVFAADCTRTYVVQSGDICDSISAANDVSTYQLAVVNPQIDETCSNLVPGDELCLGTVGEDCTTTYVVELGDTCNDIASAHGINGTILSLNNPQIDEDCGNVYVGEVLCVADTVQVPPAPAGSTPAATIPVTATPAAPPQETPLTQVPATTAAPAATPAPEPSPAPLPTPEEDNEDEGDDEDIPEDQLPFCDEL